MTPHRRSVRDLPLLWKLLVPSLVLTLVLGGAGASILIGYVRANATTALDQRLFTRAVDANVFVRDETVSLVEAVRVAGNLEGLPEALGSHNRNRAAGLLLGVPAVRDRLDLLVATDAGGTGLVELRRERDGLQSSSGSTFAATFAAKALQAPIDAAGDKQAGIFEDRGAPMLAVAVPVQTDHVVGAVIVGERLDNVVREAARRLGAAVTIYGRDGRLLASSRPAEARPVAVEVTAERTRRLHEHRAGQNRAVLYSRLRIRGEGVGTLATAIASRPFYAPVRGAEARIMVLIGLAMVGILGVGAGLTRLVTRQLRPLVETNRALGHGDLSARAAVYTHDELGEVALGLNQMAEQLQASYAELEMRVAARTEELQRVYDELAAALRNRTEVFAAMSHEFRSPLFAIRVHADMLGDPSFRPPKRNWRPQFADTIRSSADMLLSRVNDMLDIARIETAGVELNVSEVAIGDVIDDIAPLAAALARRGDLALRVEVAPGLPVIHGDRDRLREVVMNLVSNAVKYTPAGGSVAVTAGEVEGGVELVVTDTGVGIPADAGDRIFEPFYRVRGVESLGEPSTGLGLALVQRFVHAHGGDLSYVSRPGGGTAFRVHLPAGPSRRAVEGTGGSDRRVLAVQVHRNPSDEHADCDSGKADHEHRALQACTSRPPEPDESLVA